MAPRRSPARADQHEKNDVRISRPPLCLVCQSIQPRRASMSKVDSDIMDEPAGRRRKELAIEAKMRRDQEKIRIETENAAHYERLAAIKPSIDSDMTDEKHWERREKVLAEAHARRVAEAKRIAQENAAQRERLAAIKSPGRQREAASPGASPTRTRPTAASSRPHSAYPEYSPLEVHDNPRPIDEALRALRAQLPSSMRPQSAQPPGSMHHSQPTSRPQSSKPLQRPSLAPPPTPPEGSTLLYMAPFYSSAIRDARVRHGPHKDWSKVKPNKARPDTIRPIGASREKPRLPKKLAPGDRPYGYRIQSCHPSAPAVTILGRIALHPDVDPMTPDIEIPGPGRYDMLKY